MKFSVLIPVYAGDKAKIFKKALQSIKNNTIKPDQVVLVIDGPISSCLESVIKDEADDTFDILKIEKNQGIVNALNCGIEKCRHLIIARCDSDDINVNNRFELQIEEFKNDHDLDIVGGQIVENSGNNQWIRYTPLSKEKIVKFLKHRSPFNHMTVMYKKEKIMEVGCYPNIKYREDYALWAKIIASGAKVKNLNSVLVLASGGDAMYQRRGNISHIKYEYKLQKLLIRLKIINIFEFLLNITLRSLNMMVPHKVRKFIYQCFLRKKINIL